MASYNHVSLLGNLTREPEQRFTPKGTVVAEVGLAVNDRVKKNDEWVDETTYVEIVFFGRLAEVVCEYLKMGSQIFIDGRLKFESWEKDGIKRNRLKVIANSMQMLGSPKKSDDVNTSGTQPDETSFESTQYATAPVDTAF